jgi:hypothetical protein
MLSSPAELEERAVALVVAGLVIDDLPAFRVDLMVF